MNPVSIVRSRVESLLLVTDEPVTADALAGVLDVSPSEVTQALQEMSAEFDARGSGFELRERENAWRLYTRRSNSHIVEAFLLDGTQQRLSRAALETLAVVAYRQPCTRSQVAAVRGVNCDGVMRTLALRGLIAQVEVNATKGPATGSGVQTPGDGEETESDAPAQPQPDEHRGAHLYRTTELFLELMGISGLDELPDLAPLLPDVESIEAEGQFF